MKQVALPIMVGETRVLVSEYIVGDRDLSFITRQGGQDKRIREMVLNTSFSKLARWHHLTPQPSIKEHFPELSDEEVNFLMFGNIYDETKNNHEKADGFAINFDR